MLVIEFCPYLMRELGGDPESVINLVARFNKVAVMRGGKAETPKYSSPVEAVALLRDKLRGAVTSDEDYLDIIAIRST